MVACSRVDSRIPPATARPPPLASIAAKINSSEDELMPQEAQLPAGRRNEERRRSMTDYKYDNVKVRVQDGIAWAALNRPAKRNAMSPALHYDMDDALAKLEVDN